MFKMTAKSAVAPPRPATQGACSHLPSPCYATSIPILFKWR